MSMSAETSPHVVQLTSPGSLLGSLRPPQMMQSCLNVLSTVVTARPSWLEPLVRPLPPVDRSRLGGGARLSRVASHEPFNALASSDPAGRVPPVDNVSGPTFDLVKDQSHVFADDAEEEQLDAAEETQGGNQRRPARHLYLAQRVEQELANSSNHADAGDHQPQTDAEPQRHLGKRADPVEGEVDERRRAVVRAPAFARRRLERYVGQLETDPAHKPTQERVLFR